MMKKNKEEENLDEELDEDNIINYEIGENYILLLSSKRK